MHRRFPSSVPISHAIIYPHENTTSPCAMRMAVIVLAQQPKGIAELQSSPARIILVRRGYHWMLTLWLKRDLQMSMILTYEVISTTERICSLNPSHRRSTLPHKYMHACGTKGLVSCQIRTFTSHYTIKVQNATLPACIGAHG